MGERLSCSTNGLMLQKLLTYGTFLVREGADVSASGMLLGCVDTLARKGPDQDALDAISGRSSALEWVYNGLILLQNADSVFGMLRPLQAWKWYQRLLLEELERPLSHETSLLRRLLHKLSFSIYACEWKARNFSTTVQSAEIFSATTFLKYPRDAGALAMFERNITSLRHFESARFAVPITPSTLHRAEGPLAHPICHTATMAGTALGPDVKHLLYITRIVNVSGLPVFVTLHHVGAARTYTHIQLWRFTPRESRDVAKPHTDVLRVKSGQCTPPQDFDAGAFHGGCLWLPGSSADADNTLGFHVNVEPERAPLVETWSPAGMEGRRGASIVTCGDLLIAFGGTSGAQVPPTWHSGVSVLDMRSSNKEWASQWTGHSSPLPRQAHCAWMLGQYMYVFGGVGLDGLGSARALGHSDDMSTRGVNTINDLWRLDTLTWTWQEIHAAGVHPCPRSHAGLATDGSRVFIVGGKTLASPPSGFVKKQVLLADIFEFHTEYNCWIQVLPGAGAKAWMSARHSPACAVLDSGHLAVLGGFDAKDQPIAMEACLTFNITRCNVAAVMEHISFPGERGAGEVIPLVATPLARLSLSYMDVRKLSDREGGPAGLYKMKDLMEGEIGTCTFFTRDTTSIAAALLGPLDLGGFSAPLLDARTKGLLRGLRLRLSNDRETAYPCTNIGEFPWQFECNPFHTVPRWLGFPCEGYVNMKAEQVGAPGVVRGFTQVVKIFSTQKAAALYWEMTQPKLLDDSSGSPWRVFQADRAVSARWDGDEGEADLSGGCVICEAGKAAQMYCTAVTGHVYGAFLVTFEPFPRFTIRDAKVFASIAAVCWSTPCNMLHRVAMQGMYLHCAFCGKTEHLALGEQAQVIKVCRGCHLVRYCSLECQAAAWPHHKSVCQRRKQQAGLLESVNPDHRSLFHSITGRCAA